MSGGSSLFDQAICEPARPFTTVQGQWYGAVVVRAYDVAVHIQRVIATQVHGPTPGSARPPGEAAVQDEFRWPMDQFHELLVRTGVLVGGFLPVPDRRGANRPLGTEFHGDRSGRLLPGQTLEVIRPRFRELGLRERNIRDGSMEAIAH